MSGFLVINPRSGQGSTTDELRDAATRLGIETHVLGPAEDAADVAREAPKTALGMAGGDGSLSSVAEVAVELELPFVAVPFGTFNHFARDLGIDRGDPARALRAFSGSEKRIDVARVNGRLFLNNVSLGLYARLVHRREGRGTAAMLKALGLLARHPSGLGVTVDGKRAHARVLVVSNNHYDLDLFAIGERDRLDEGLLYLYVAHGWLPSAWEEQGGRRFLSTRKAVPSKRRSTASPRPSRPRSASRSSRPRYASCCRKVASTSRVCGNASSSLAISSGANQRNSATSSSGSGTPSTMRAVQ